MYKRQIIYQLHLLLYEVSSVSTVKDLVPNSDTSVNRMPPRLIGAVADLIGVQLPLTLYMQSIKHVLYLLNITVYNIKNL